MRKRGNGCTNIVIFHSYIYNINLFIYNKYSNHTHTHEVTDIYITRFVPVNELLCLDNNLKMTRYISQLNRPGRVHESKYYL